MNTTNNFIFFLEEHQEIQAKHSEFIRFGVSFPDNVFKESSDNLKLIYFDEMLTQDFWLLLSAFADWAGDMEITMLIHEPDPITYYFDHYQHHGSLTFDHPSLSKTYSEILNTPFNHFNESLYGSDELLYSACTISWIGTSGRWCFFGDRYFSMGTVIVRGENIFWPVAKESIDRPIEFLSIEEALDTMCFHFKKQTIPKEFISEFRKNYDR